MQSTEIVRGPDRERSLPKNAFFNDEYFSIEQLGSFVHQLHDIHRLNVTEILEIGVGNGFTSSILRQSGIRVTTVDINENLSPDICCEIRDLSKHLGDQKFELIVCCQVLEHLPIEDFEDIIKKFRGVADRLYLTLPIQQNSFGFGGLFRLPFLGPRLISVQFGYRPDRPIPDEHFWEIGSKGGPSKAEVISRLRRHYPSVQVARFALNPYHISFTCS